MLSDVTIIIMFIPLLFSWWYGRGWLWTIRSSRSRLRAINEIFSVSILIRTLFSPWKQIESKKTFQNFIQSTVDNFISRLIGAVLRFFMLLTALILTLLVLVFGLLAVIIWPLIPLFIVVLPILMFRLVG